MRGLVLVTALLLALAAGSASAGTQSRTALTVAYWAEGTSSAKTVWTLRCDPAGGTLKRPARACRHLAEGGRQLFAPVKRGEICTQIYGGPEVAIVSGMLDGRRVWARFQRRNGCEIDRWNRLSPWLLPAGGVT